MSKWQVSALAVAGLVLSALGLLMGIAFAVPALGFNVYGPNPVSFTIAVEAVGMVIYLGGATMSWFAWRNIFKQGIRRGRAAVLVAPVVVLIVTLALDVVHSYWIDVVETLVFVVGLVLPVVAAARPWSPGRISIRGR